MPILESIVGSLNPDAGKIHYQYLDKNRTDAFIETYENDIVKGFIQNSKISEIENEIYKEVSEIALLKDNWNGEGTQKINFQVIDNTLNVLGSIAPSVLYYLCPNNIYPSKYGTIIIDFEFGNKDNYVSLEIAKNSIGYFVEKDGIDYKQIEKLETNEESFDASVASINNDLSLFM